MSEHSTSPFTLAAFMFFLRMKRQALGMSAFSKKMKFSQSTIYNLEGLRLRTSYEHIEAYADYFGVPSGVMLLITRIGAKARILHKERLSAHDRFLAENELENLLRGIEGLVRGIGPLPVTKSRASRRGSKYRRRARAIADMLDMTASDERRIYFPIFEHFLDVFDLAAGGVEQFRNSSPRRNSASRGSDGSKKVR